MTKHQTAALLGGAAAIGYYALFKPIPTGDAINDNLALAKHARNATVAVFVGIGLGYLIPKGK